MRTPSLHAERLVQLLQRRKIATMAECKKALGTKVDVSVFRKLKPLGYRSSYSHRGSYYTLQQIPRFDEHGLWSYNSVWFSRYGTLLASAEAFVNRCEAGYFTAELQNLLHAGVKQPLLQLVRQGRIAREKVAGRYLYCSIDAVRQQRQMRARRQRQAEPGLGAGLLQGERVSAEVKAAMVLFFSLLDEKQRRLGAGLESLKLGPGGDRQVAEVLGMDPHTVARGKHELLEHDFEVERVRRGGGGRKPVKQNARSHPSHRRVDEARHRRRP